MIDYNDQNSKWQRKKENNEWLKRLNDQENKLSWITMIDYNDQNSKCITVKNDLKIAPRNVKTMCSHNCCFNNQLSF